MKKRILSFILALSAIFSICVIGAVNVSALPTPKTGTSSGSVDVYCLPDNTSSMRIGSIGAESVSVYWGEGNSYYIQYTVSSGANSGYKRGYVPKSAITVSGTVGGINYTSRQAHTVSNTAVYNRSNTSSLSIGTVYSTDTITILQEDGNWYYIQYPTSSVAKRGYIPKSAVSTGTTVTWDTYGNMGWSYPLNSPTIYKKISNAYSTSHRGIDIISNNSTTINGQSIKCPTSGTVVYSKYETKAGYTIIIETNQTDPYNNEKILVGFQHMQAKSSYDVDDTVTKNAVLGKVGTTGTASTGYHLHLYMRSDDQLWTNYAGRTINPQAFFPSIAFTGSTSTLLCTDD